MNIQKTIGYIKNFAVIPFLATSLSMGGVASPMTISSISFAKIDTFFAETKEDNKIIDEQKEKAEKIDAYFLKRDMPLHGYGLKLVAEAEKNNLDWRLLAGIAVRESTGGKFACKSKPHNPFGWGSCKIGFESFDHAIETVGKNLGGNNPNTKYYYHGKTTEDILKAYNPPSIVPLYAPQVIAIMDAIEKGE